MECMQTREDHESLPTQQHLLALVAIFVAGDFEGVLFDVFELVVDILGHVVVLGDTSVECGDAFAVAFKLGVDVLLKLPQLDFGGDELQHVAQCQVVVALLEDLEAGIGVALPLLHQCLGNLEPQLLLDFLIVRHVRVLLGHLELIAGNR